MQRFFYKNIKSNFTTNCCCVALLLLYCAGSMASNPKKACLQREFDFDISTAINEYKRYYWHYPNSIESFTAFGESYDTNFWKDIEYKDKTNATWFLTYKKIKDKKNNYQIVTLDNNHCVFTDFKKQKTLVFKNNICEDCRLGNINISDFKRQYSTCAFDYNGNILWNHSESLNQLSIEIQREFNRVQTSVRPLNFSRAEMILFKYSHSDDTITFLCDLDDCDFALFEIVETNIHRLLNAFCNKHTDISGINMYAYLSK